MIDILSLGIGSKFSDIPSKNLVAPIGGYTYVDIKFIVHWEALNFDCTFSGNQIIANDATNFITQGFKIGDTIHVETLDSVNVNDGDYEIIALSPNIMWVAVIDSGSSSIVTPISFTTQIGVQASVYGTTPVETIDYFFGLVENSSSPAYTSLIDGETQRFKADSVNASSSAFLLPYTANKSWLSGDPTDQGINQVVGTGIGTSLASTGYEQCFTLTHAMHITPAILNSFIDTSGEVQIGLVPWFNLGSCLKYVPRITAGFESLSVDHTTDNGNINTVLQPGDTGFYDEHRNGGAPKFELESVAYEVDGNIATTINTVGETAVEIKIKKLTSNFTGNERVDLYVYEIPDDSADYQNNPNTIWTNFNVSNLFMDMSETGLNDTNISNAATSIATDILTITFDYSPGDPARRFFIYVDVGTYTEKENKSDHHTVLVALDYPAFYIDTANVLISERVFINDHTSNDEDLAFSDYKGWVEDGLLARKKFQVKKKTGTSDEYDVELTKLSVNISCEHNTDSTRKFVLENVVYTIPENTDRGFLLPTADPKNYKILNQLPGTTDYYEYQLEHATKLGFEQNITLPGADPDFPLATQKWSYYDSNPAWSVYLNILITLTVSNDDVEETYTDTHKVRIRIKDYDKYDGCQKSCIISTYDAATGSLATPLTFKTKNTKVIARFYGKSLFPCIYEKSGTEIVQNVEQCTFDQLVSGSGYFSNDEGSLSECPDYYGILEINPVNGNRFTIDQISTIWDKRSGSKWIGTVDPDRAKLTAFPFATPEPYIEVEAVVDYTAIDTTISHYYSARLGKVAVFCHKSIMTIAADSLTTYTNSYLDSFSDDQLFVFVKGREYITQGDVSASDGTLTFSSSVADDSIIKICCAKNKIHGTTNGSGEYTNSLLVGLSVEDFIVFLSGNGREATTAALFSFNSGTGTFSGLPVTMDIDISFHESIVYDNLSAAANYTDSSLIGRSLEDLMIFVNGEERTSFGDSLSGDTITFLTAQTGIIKIIYLNQ